MNFRKPDLRSPYEPMTSPATPHPIRILYVGETWKGSSARSMLEALSGIPGVWIDEIGEDHYLPRHRMFPLRVVNRLARPLCRLELRREVELKCREFRPDVLMVYKGNGIGPDVIEWSKRRRILTVNVFPDPSPHYYGPRLQAAMGLYDLVVSAKPFHPPNWHGLYGYRNSCVCVPHGYDPAVHYWSDPPGRQDVDVMLAASWRPQYESLMLDLAAELRNQPLTVALVGPGWSALRARYPSHWQFPGAVFGRTYGETVRRAKIVIAPVHREVFVRGVQQPGDEDTTRTYELAAAGCFFLHRRTRFVSTLYDDRSEVPMWDDAKELAAQIMKYLPLESTRREMAARAHAKAVPAFSIAARAQSVLDHTRLALRRLDLLASDTLP